MNVCAACGELISSTEVTESGHHFCSEDCREQWRQAVDDKARDKCEPEEPEPYADWDY